MPRAVRSEASCASCSSSCISATTALPYECTSLGHSYTIVAVISNKNRIILDLLYKGREEDINALHCSKHTSMREFSAVASTSSSSAAARVLRERPGTNMPTQAMPLTPVGGAALVLFSEADSSLG